MPRTGVVVGVLVVLWIAVGAVISGVRANRPTPEKITAYLASHSLIDASPQQRARTIDHVANSLNRLDFESRRSLQRSEPMRRFFDSLTDSERNDFLDRTLPEGFRQVMLALNKMTPEKRREIVERALENLKNGRGPGDDVERPPADEAMVRKIVAQGMTSFYEEANASVKLDFAPVIEQIQQSLQWRH